MEIKPTGIKGFSVVYDDEGNVTMTLTYIEPKEKDQLQNNWNELKSWGEKKIENANKYLKDPNENWDEDARGYVLARKFQLEEMLKAMQELENRKV